MCDAPGQRAQFPPLALNKRERDRSIPGTNQWGFSTNRDGRLKEKGIAE
jgi:hypothetical protein